MFSFIIMGNYDDDDYYYFFLFLNSIFGLSFLLAMYVVRMLL